MLLHIIKQILPSISRDTLRSSRTLDRENINSCPIHTTKPPIPAPITKHQQTNTLIRFYPIHGIPQSTQLSYFCIRMKKTLANTALRQRVKVNGLVASDISSKLLEMGFYEGQEVEVLFKAPFGDPIAVNVGGYVLSLRLNEACLVEVQ